VDTIVYFPRPKSHYGTGRNAGKLKATAPTHNDGKPDRDNLDKAILDAMTGIGFMRDDKQVVAGEAPEKLYVCDECEWKPGALIVVSVKSSDVTGVPQ
jgi:Holliday junction resolvase RusA-like endonuclease